MVEGFRTYPEVSVGVVMVKAVAPYVSSVLSSTPTLGFRV